MAPESRSTIGHAFVGSIMFFLRVSRLAFGRQWPKGDRPEAPASWRRSTRERQGNASKIVTGSQLDVSRRTLSFAWGRCRVPPSSTKLYGFRSPNRIKLSAVAMRASSFERGVQPRTRLAFSLVAFLILPISGRSCRKDRSRLAASRTTQSGN